VPSQGASSKIAQANRGQAHAHHGVFAGCFPDAILHEPYVQIAPNRGAFTRSFPVSASEHGFNLPARQIRPLAVFIIRGTVLLLLFNGRKGWELVYRRHVDVSDIRE
jgi:hypothetical protein